MSFGFGLGDFFLVTQLCWQVGEALNEAPRKYRFLQTEVQWVLTPATWPTLTSEQALQLALNVLQRQVAESEALLEDGPWAQGKALNSIVSTIEAELGSLNDCLKSCKSLGTSKRVFSDRLTFARRNPEPWLVSISRLVLYINNFQLYLQTESLVWPQRSTLAQEAHAANGTSYALEAVPSSIRESWARQMLAAVVEVHSKGCIVGNIHLKTFVITAEGRVVLSKFITSSRETPINYGCMPPEWRKYGVSDERCGPRAFNRHTDLF